MNGISFMQHVSIGYFPMLFNKTIFKHSVLDAFEGKVIITWKYTVFFLEKQCSGQDANHFIVI